jgi:hypothetical protein
VSGLPLQAEDFNGLNRYYLKERLFMSIYLGLIMYPLSGMGYLPETEILYITALSFIKNGSIKVG